MDCKLPDSCPYSQTCTHKDLAEFCPYHRLNYTDPSQEFKEAVYPTIIPTSKEPAYIELRKFKKDKSIKEALRSLKKEDFYDPFDPQGFEGFKNRS